MANFDSRILKTREFVPMLVSVLIPVLVLIAPPVAGASADPACPSGIVKKEKKKPKPRRKKQNVLDFKAKNLKQKTNKRYRLDGNIRIQYDDIELKAESAELDRDAKQVAATGAIALDTEDLHFSGKKIVADLNKKALKIEQAKFKSKPSSLAGSAKSIAANTEKGQLTLKEGKISTCPKDQETWHLSASEISLDQKEGWGKAKGMAMYLGGLPIFYFPRLSFPISSQRKSGFLYPEINRSSRNGVSVSTPYYFNLAENYDATLVPRVMTGSGMQISGEFRFLSDNFQGKVLGEYLPDDRNFNINAGEERIRYLGHVFVENPNQQAPLSYEFNYTTLSDDNYVRDLGSMSRTAGEYVTQQLKIGYRHENYDLTFLLNTDKSLNSPTSPYQRLPQITLNYSSASENFSLNWSWLTELSYFDNDNVVTGARLHSIPTVELPMIWESGYLNTRVEYPLTLYSQSGAPGTEQSVFRALPVISVDSGLELDRYFTWRDKRWLQTLSPRLFALYSPHENQENINIFDTGLLDRGYQQLFRNNRFIGYDRLGDARQVTLALETRFVDTVRNLQTVSARLGRAYYLDPPLTLLQGNSLDGEAEKHSPFISDLSYHINRNWFVTTGIEWDSDASRTDRSYLRLNYAAENNRVFNLIHRLSVNEDEDDVEQIDFSVVWPIRDKWHVIGRWQNDLQNHRTLETFFGLEYRECCWSIRFINRRALDVELDNNGFPVTGLDAFTSEILLEFVFNGLTSVGESNLGPFLEKNIYGYENLLGN